MKFFPFSIEINYFSLNYLLGGVGSEDPGEFQRVRL